MQHKFFIQIFIYHYCYSIQFLFSHAYTGTHVIGIHSAHLLPFSHTFTRANYIHPFDSFSNHSFHAYQHSTYSSHSFNQSFLLAYDGIATPVSPLRSLSKNWRPNLGQLYHRYISNFSLFSQVHKKKKNRFALNVSHIS